MKTETLKSIHEKGNGTVDLWIINSFGIESVSLGLNLLIQKKLDKYIHVHNEKGQLHLLKQKNWFRICI